MITRAKAGIHKLRDLTYAYVLKSIPSTVVEALASPYWKKAMIVKYDALHKNGTWSLVPYTPYMNIITNKWVFRTKLKFDATLDKFKARLVARGFQQTPCVDYFDTFDLVAKHFMIPDLFTMVFTFGWKVQQIDVNNAFLNGFLNETVNMVQPKGFEDKSKADQVVF